MKLKAYAVRDHKVGAFNRPYFVQTDGAAIRAFSDEVQRVSDDNPMYRHPEDYALFAVGEYEDESGKMSGYSSPKQLITAGECVKAKVMGES